MEAMTCRGRTKGHKKLYAELLQAFFFPEEQQRTGAYSFSSSGSSGMAPLCVHT